MIALHYQVHLFDWVATVFIAQYRERKEMTKHEKDKELILGRKCMNDLNKNYQQSGIELQGDSIFFFFSFLTDPVQLGLTFKQRRKMVTESVILCENIFKTLSLPNCKSYSLEIWRQGSSHHPLPDLLTVNLIFNWIILMDFFSEAH